MTTAVDARSNMRPISPGQNRLLGALPPAELERLSAHLELVALPLGEMLYGPEQTQSHAYFPVTSIVALHCVMESDASAVVAAVGLEGMVGVSLFMGGETVPNSAVVLTAGRAYRLERATLKRDFDRAGALQQLLLRYTQALIAQIGQTAVCNRHHSLEQQLCRWLLATLDRVPAREVVLTQYLISSILGVRREGVTEAAGRLQRAGLIRYRRGHISVLDRAGLETYTCECYATVRNENERLLSK